MKKYLKHIITALVCFLFIVILNFALPRLLQGDPIAYLTGFDEEEMSAELYNYYYHALHLDENIFVQFGFYLKSLFDGTLGYSYKAERVVSSLINERIGYSLQITIPAILISLALGLFLGMHSGYKKESSFDKISTTSLIFVNSIPAFAIALVLVITLCVQAQLFPYSGLNGLNAKPGTIQFFFDRIYHLILPILSIVISTLPSRYLLVRNTTAKFVDDKSVLYAKQRGLSDRKIKYNYMLKNTIQPYISMAGTAIGSSIGGSIVVENIFSINGVGGLLNSAIYTLDYPLMQGILFVTAFFMIICVILSDLICIIIDPKIKKGARSYE